MDCDSEFTLNDLPVRCEHCSKDFCWSHRKPHYHNCWILKKEAPAPEEKLVKEIELPKIESVSRLKVTPLPKLEFIGDFKPVESHEEDMEKIFQIPRSIPKQREIYKESSYYDDLFSYFQEMPQNEIFAWLAVVLFIFLALSQSLLL